jgi:hypothetical protein
MFRASLAHRQRRYTSGTWYIAIYQFFAFVLDGNGSLHSPTALSPWKEPSVPIAWEAWWNQSQYETLGSEQNLLSVPEIDHDSSVDQNVAYSRYGTHYPGSCQRANEAIKHTCFIQSKILHLFLIFSNTSVPDDKRTHPGNF